MVYLRQLLSNQSTSSSPLKKAFYSIIYSDVLINSHSLLFYDQLEKISKLSSFKWKSYYQLIYDLNYCQKSEHNSIFLYCLIWIEICRKVFSIFILTSIFVYLIRSSIMQLLFYKFKLIWAKKPPIIIIHHTFTYSDSGKLLAPNGVHTFCPNLTNCIDERIAGTFYFNNLLFLPIFELHQNHRNLFLLDYIYTVNPINQILMVTSYCLRHTSLKTLQLRYLIRQIIFCKF